MQLILEEQDTNAIDSWRAATRSKESRLMATRSCCCVYHSPYATMLTQGT